MEKIKLIYISSLGHSGSTLLDVLLNQHSAIQSVGEVMHYDEWLTKGLLCTCGEPLTQCSFWTKVNQPLRIGDISAPDYLDNTFKLYSGIQNVSGQNIIVDSSKSVSRLIRLLSDNRFEVKVIHLVRNGLAVVNSLSKSHDRPGTGNTIKTPATPLLKGVLRWVRRNRSMENLINRVGNDAYLRLCYEDLCTQPEQVLRDICNFAGIDFENDMLDPNLGDNHNIGGSRWRFSDRVISVKLDDKWRSEVSGLTKFIFNIFGGRLNRSYGYSNETP